jgi:hypothetical protein
MRNNKIVIVDYGVGMYSHTHNVEMTRRYRKDHDWLDLCTEKIFMIQITMLFFSNVQRLIIYSK